MAKPLFEVEGLRVGIRSGERWATAVADASFSVAPGEVLALVGESAAGKSLMAMGSVNLLRAGSRVEAGKTTFDGHDLAGLPEEEWREVVGTGIGTIFQDPIGAFDPILTIGEQSGEVLEEHTELTDQEIQQRVFDALGEVKLPKTRKFLSFPYQMSRGEAQRAMLASVLLSKPKLLIADEPVTGLDVTVARAVLDLIDDLRKKRGMAMVLVTHDLGVVAGMADRVAVVYGGAIVEDGPTSDVFRNPLHPYTEGLLGSIPWLRMTGERLRPIEGDAPDLAHLPTFCAFAPRCPYVEARCRSDIPGRRLSIFSRLCQGLRHSTSSSFARHLHCGQREAI